MDGIINQVLKKMDMRLFPILSIRKEVFLEKVQSIKPDFILITKDEIDIEVLSECKKYTKLIQWYPDPVIPEWLIPYVKTVDLFFTMSEGLVEKFKKYNSNTFWLTQAFEPDFFQNKRDNR